MKRRLKKYLRFLIPTLIVLILVPVSTHYVKMADETLEGRQMRCVISLRGHRSSKMHLSTGFAYELLKRFAEDKHFTADISLSMAGQRDTLLPSPDYLDSLKLDSVQIVVLPYSDSLVRDRSIICTAAFFDSTAWAVNGDAKWLDREMNEWISHFRETPDYKKLVDRFTPSYEPSSRVKSGRKYSVLSPYDKLIKKYSAKLGWDWRQLAALVWQESKFRIEARSGKGAVGLMQMMPHTARRFDVDNMLDPDENLGAAVNYLLKLEKMMQGRVAPESLWQAVLACYNAGEGRIIDCINLANSKGIAAGAVTWEDIVNVIPEMRNEDILQNENIRLGMFQGYQTIAYIDRVTEIYNAFLAIAPSPSGQDQPATRTDKAALTEALSQDTTANQPAVSPED